MHARYVGKKWLTGLGALVQKNLFYKKSKLLIWHIMFAVFQLQVSSCPRLCNGFTICNVKMHAYIWLPLFRFKQKIITIVWLEKSVLMMFVRQVRKTDFHRIVVEANLNNQNLTTCKLCSTTNVSIENPLYSIYNWYISIRMQNILKS